MRKLFTLIAFLTVSTFLIAQSPGDTIRVQAFDYNSETRDTMISFPDIPNLTYEKIILKYGMRCTDGLVSTGTQRNLGCGEWDYSCNTYLIDSTKIESQTTFINSHFITNFDGDVFSYSETPVFDYLRGVQTEVEITESNNESSASIGTGTEPLTRTLSTDNTSGRSQFLYTAQELTDAGLFAGEVAGISMNILDSAGEANFLKILAKNSSKTELSSLDDTDGFTELYYRNTNLVANEANRFQFHEPFIWDGTSNVIVEFNFLNANASNQDATLVEGELIENSGLSSSPEKELIITDRAYIECNDYTGIVGTSNRTVEAWIKTTSTGNGEIISFGQLVTGGKWTLRLTGGRLRLEVQGGGTESASAINDGEWHHIACVQDGPTVGNTKFYIDGNLDANQVAGSTAIDTRDFINLRVSRGLNNRYLEVTIDDLRLWDTALSNNTINEWKNLKVTDTHPNFDNLQLHFNFEGKGQDIIDSSIHGRNATMYGSRISVSELGGEDLIKDFELLDERPNITFFQGEYETVINETAVDRPLIKEPRHLVIERSIEQTDPTQPFDDNIITTVPQELWTPEFTIFDEATGAIIEQNSVNIDGEINIGELEYQRRFPFYNELVSFVTPYGIGLDLGDDGVSWDIDMSDYVSILKGDKRIQMTLGGQWQEEMDLEFLFIVGTPPRDVVQYDQIWQGTNRIGIANINDIMADVKFAPASVPLSSEASTFKVRSSVTGHGSEGEFGQNGGVVTHFLRLDEGAIFDWRITQECSFNPVYPQGGTWIFDRQGWCPGEQTKINEFDLTGLVEPGGALNIDYYTSNPAVSTGDYRYHVAHQLVGYGEPNFQNDASLIEIMAPNNGIEFTRVGTICANPTVVIRNTGAQTLTSLTINYWINDAQTPQTYEWEGSLDFMEDEEVTIPSTAELWFDILDENNRFYAEISNPNGAADQYEFNNTKNSTFDVPTVFVNDLQISIRTNNRPTENSYTLTDAAGNVIGSNNLPAANTTYTDEYSLEGGCYTLSVVDTGGDGMQWFANPAQGAGTVRILNENGISIRLFEPDFGGGFDFNFSTDFVLSSEEIEFLTSIEVFPNPASDICTIKANDLSDATIYLTDVLGRQVATDIHSQFNEAVTMDINHLEAGIYFIVIKRDEVHTTRKLIVE